MNKDDKKAWRYAFSVLLLWISGYAAGVLRESAPWLPVFFIGGWVVANLAGWLATRE